MTWILKNMQTVPHQHVLPCTEDVYEVQDDSIFECSCGTKFTLVTITTYGRFLRLVIWKDTNRYWISEQGEKIRIEEKYYTERID